MRFIYDIETYPNFFCVWFFNPLDSSKYYFEISDVQNDSDALMTFIKWCSNNNHSGVGFNNVMFDYPVIHVFFKKNLKTAFEIYEVAQKIIDIPFNQRFSVSIKKPLFKQVDLYLINHYDNVARHTSLKTLEINMGMKRVQDLPYQPSIPIPKNGFNEVKEYCFHDVIATAIFDNKCKDAHDLRKDLSVQYNIDMTNFSDAKIGSSIFNSSLSSCDVELYENRHVKQTLRDNIYLKDCILPYIDLKSESFRSIHAEILTKSIHSVDGEMNTKGLFSDLSTTYKGLHCKFGLGGLHGSVSKKTFTNDNDYLLFELDVVSYYPNLSIKNNLYPDHLSTVFCTVYNELFHRRKSYKKTHPMNKALKLALNSTFGNSGNKYSVMYDMKFMLSITLNGQLLMSMLIEMILNIKTASIITVNTDGLVIHVHGSQKEEIENVKKTWENITKLTLEYTYYKLYAVRDVNNYYAETI